MKNLFKESKKNLLYLVKPHKTKVIETRNDLTSLKPGKKFSIKDIVVSSVNDVYKGTGFFGSGSSIQKFNAKKTDGEGNSIEVDGLISYHKHLLNSNLSKEVWNSYKDQKPISLNGVVRSLGDFKYH
jgi:hypothetical protein